MYGKLFVQMYDSSIVEDPEARLTLMDMVILCDQNGVCDMTHEAFARRTNRPVELIRETISRLESPDHRSRNPNMEGVRLARLDQHRDWGWMVVNYEYFRKISTGEQRREKTRERTRRWREKEVVTHGDAREQAGEIYNAYPRKVARPEALRAITKALERGTTFMDLLGRTEQYASARKGCDPKFTPHPATWFNQERYNDDPETWKDAQPMTRKDAEKQKQADSLDRLRRAQEELNGRTGLETVA